jgi:hypothetical protein
MTSRTASAWAIAGLVVLACVARIAHLGADPYFPTWIQYVVDEGRWNETARNLVLFSSSDGSYIGRLHLTLSPGFQAINYVVFRIFGVAFWSARAFAAVSGILVVVCVTLALRRHVTASALALGVVILGFETNLLAESRLALPEMPSLFAMLLAFLLLVVGRKTRWNAFLAGVIAAVAVALKGTSILMVPILPLIMALSPEAGPARERIMRALAFATGLGLPLVAGLSVALALGLFDAKGLMSASIVFVEFLSVADPRLIVWRYFESTDLEIRNLMLFGIWFCSWIWFHRRANASPVTREIYLMSGLWAGWWLVLWSINDYSPGRYVVHFVVPATIHIMAGLSLGGRDTIARIAGSLARSKGLTRAALLTWLVVPTAIFVATTVAGLAQYVGLDASRVSTRIAMIVALAGMIAAAASRGGPKEGTTAGFLIFPVLMVLVWLGGRELGVFDVFWNYDPGAGAARWLAVTALIAAACFSLAFRPRAPQWNSAVLLIVIVLLAAIFMAQGAHPVLAPTYSIRDASRQLGKLFSGARTIRTLHASSLFLENDLRYRELARNDIPYDVLVLFEHNRSSRKFLQSPRAVGLVRVQTYPLTIHPRYGVDEATEGPASIAVYKPS